MKNILQALSGTLLRNISLMGIKAINHLLLLCNQNFQVLIGCDVFSNIESWETRQMLLKWSPCLVQSLSLPPPHLILFFFFLFEQSLIYYKKKRMTTYLGLWLITPLLSKVYFWRRHFYWNLMNGIFASFFLCKSFLYDCKLFWNDFSHKSGELVWMNL